MSVTAVLVTVGAFSATAPLTAYVTGSALALALGRNALGLLTLGPVVVLIRRREFRAGEGELLQQLTKRCWSPALERGITDHVGQSPGGPPSRLRPEPPPPTPPDIVRGTP